MAEPQMVDPHDVVMTGENSFIRLSNDGGKHLADRVSHWRVLWSPAGQGHALGQCQLRDAGARYTAAVQDGDISLADEILADVPEGSVEAVKSAAVEEYSSAITVSMSVLSAVALAGAIFAWLVIGRRRTPDHSTMPETAAG